MRFNRGRRRHWLAVNQKPFDVALNGLNDLSQCLINCLSG